MTKFKTDRTLKGFILQTEGWGHYGPPIYLLARSNVKRLIFFRVEIFYKQKNILKKSQIFWF